MGRIDEAVADETAAIELAPDTYILAQAYTNRGFGYGQLGLSDQARADLEMVDSLTDNPGLLLRANELLLELDGWASVGNDADVGEAKRLANEAYEALDERRWDDAVAAATAALDRLLRFLEPSGTRVCFDTL